MIKFSTQSNGSGKVSQKRPKFLTPKAADKASNNDSISSSNTNSVVKIENDDNMKNCSIGKKVKTFQSSRKAPADRKKVKPPAKPYKAPSKTKQRDLVFDNVMSPSSSESVPESSKPTIIRKFHWKRKRLALGLLETVL